MITIEVPVDDEIVDRVVIAWLREHYKFSDPNDMMHEEDVRDCYFRRVAISTLLDYLGEPMA